jgi:5'-methylthioadenosine phosphorylase
VSISAVGSLKEELKPLDIVIPNQLFDRTRLRDSSFFSSGLVVHISFAEPFCERLCELIYKEAKDKKINVHQNGVYVCIEGPQFSTRAESQFYRSMGFDIIGMTALPEAKLAREASICYAIIAVVTDYDVWYKPEESVTAEMIIENLKKGINKAKIILKEVLPKINQLGECQLCHHALKDAIVTQKDFIKEEIKEKFYHLIKEYENIT